MNKPRSHKRIALLAFSLLLIGLPCVLCFLWVRKEQRQYALNRQLIAALKRNDTKRAITLVEAGADPNTREEPTPVPTLASLIGQLLHSTLPETTESDTALVLACKTFWFGSENRVIRVINPQLTQAMLLHGADVNASGEGGWTALEYVVWGASDIQNGPADPYIGYNLNKTIIKQLLDHGADPNYEAQGEGTALERAKGSEHPDLVALLRKYSKHP